MSWAISVRKVIKEEIVLELHPLGIDMIQNVRQGSMRRAKAYIGNGLEMFWELCKAKIHFR